MLLIHQFIIIFLFFFFSLHTVILGDSQYSFVSLRVFLSPQTLPAFPASDKKHQVWKMKPEANGSTSNIFSSYLRRCLKRACMVSWLGLGSCRTSSLVDWTRCLGSGFSAGDKKSQRTDASAQGGHNARQNLLMALTKSWKRV